MHSAHWVYLGYLSRSQLKQRYSRVQHWILITEAEGLLQDIPGSLNIIRYDFCLQSIDGFFLYFCVTLIVIVISVLHLMIRNKKFSTELIINEGKWQKLNSCLLACLFYIFLNNLMTLRMTEFMAGVASGWKKISGKRSKQKWRWASSYNSLFPQYLNV